MQELFGIVLFLIAAMVYKSSIKAILDGKKVTDALKKKFGLGDNSGAPQGNNPISDMPKTNVSKKSLLDEEKDDKKPSKMGNKVGNKVAKMSQKINGLLKPKPKDTVPTDEEMQSIGTKVKYDKMEK